MGIFNRKKKSEPEIGSPEWHKQMKEINKANEGVIKKSNKSAAKNRETTSKLSQTTSDMISASSKMLKQQEHSTFTSLGQNKDGKDK